MVRGGISPYLSLKLGITTDERIITEAEFQDDADDASSKST